jgi:hypothetical protein
MFVGHWFAPRDHSEAGGLLSAHIEKVLFCPGLITVELSVAPRAIVVAKRQADKEGATAGVDAFSLKCPKQIINL